MLGFSSATHRERSALREVAARTGSVRAYADLPGSEAPGHDAASRITCSFPCRRLARRGALSGGCREDCRHWVRRRHPDAPVSSPPGPPPPPRRARQPRGPRRAARVRRGRGPWRLPPGLHRREQGHGRLAEEGEGGIIAFGSFVQRNRHEVVEVGARADHRAPSLLLHRRVERRKRPTDVTERVVGQPSRDGRGRPGTRRRSRCTGEAGPEPRRGATP